MVARRGRTGRVERRVGHGRFPGRGDASSPSVLGGGLMGRRVTASSTCGGPRNGDDDIHRPPVAGRCATLRRRHLGVVPTLSLHGSGRRRVRAVGRSARRNGPHHARRLRSGSSAIHLRRSSSGGCGGGVTPTGPRVRRTSYAGDIPRFRTAWGWRRHRYSRSPTERRPRHGR